MRNHSKSSLTFKRTASQSDQRACLIRIQLGAVGLGRNKNVWWPCRVLSIARPSNAGDSAANMKARRRPYQVEFFPYQKAQLSRSDIVLPGDEDFFTVPVSASSYDSSYILWIFLADMLVAFTARGDCYAGRRAHSRG